MKIIKENDFFKTTDIAIATTLYCYGYRLDAIDKTNPSRANFIFERDVHLDDIVQSFWAHSLKVDPLVFFSELKQIKTRLYQQVD